MAYKIYDKIGNERIAVIEDSLQPNAGRFVEPQLEYNGTWMGECFVTVNIKSPVPIEFAIGDYIMYRNEKFVINYDPSVIKKATKKSTGDAFCYDNVKFSALLYELSDIRMLDYVIGDNNIHYSGLPKFSFFCNNIEDLADRLQTNSDRYCYDNHISDSEKWLFITPSLSRTQQRAGEGIAYNRATEKHNSAFRNGTHTEDERVNQNVNIDNMSVWDSMRYIKETFGLSFVVSGRVVIIGAAWINTTGLFKYGKGNGLYEIERVADSEQQVVTKLYAYGSSKNMPDRYYADMSGSPLPNNLAVDVLMLPGFPKMSLYEWVTKPVAQGGGGGSVVDSTTGKASWSGYTAYFSQDAKTPWVMSLNSDSLGIREDTKYFDGSDGTDEIYPTIENTGADTIHSANVIEDNGVFEDGQEVANFNIYLPNLGFDLASLITSESAISIKDGYCGGRDFPIVSAQQITVPENNTDVTLWEVTCNRVKDEGTKLWYPYSDGMAHGGMYSANEPYQIRTGDKYVLVGIQMPDTYVNAASEKLLEGALLFLSKNDTTRYTYIPKVDEIYMARQALQVRDTDAPAYHDIINEGDVMNFKDADLLGEDVTNAVYIDTLRIKEYGNQQIPTYEVTLRNDKQVGTIQRIQNQIASLSSTGGGGGSGNINVPQVEQLIRVYGSDLFLSKRQDDTANGKIRFNNNVQFGHDFVGGITGVGGRIDKDANAELESLSLRRFLEVPELRYNRISIQVGNRWRAPGGGIILRVVPDEDSSGNILNTGTIYLHLEDGEIGKVAVDDICMGIYHDGMNTNDNDSDDFDDSRGNFRFSGFFTTYFTVTRIVEESDNSVFEYALRNDVNYPASHHPCDMMHFVCYGNFTNPDRQSSRYSTLTYERYLYKVNTWEFGAINIAAQFGDLSNLRVYDLDMTDYSAYLNNIYMTGRLEQIRQLADDLSSYSVDFSDYVDVITIDDVGNVIGGLYKVENNTPYDYRIHSAITVRKNSQVLTICAANEPVTTGKYKIYAEPVRCAYTLANSTIYITSIENIKDGIPGTPDDVNFDYDAMREMTNCYVNLTIDCEGKTTLVKQFPITIKHMSEPFVDADINNESSGVSWNTKTQAYIGLPIVFDMTMYHNNEVLDITSTTNVSLTTTTSGVTLTQTNGTAPSTINPSTIYYSKTIETITKFAGTPNEVTFKVARISINAMGKDVPLVTNIDVTGTAIYAGVPYERTLTHTINKSTDTNVYSVLPIPSEVVVSKIGSLSENSIACDVICDSSDDKHYTVLPTDFFKHNLALRYKRFYTDGSYDTDYQIYSGAVTVNSGMKKVVFYLFGTVNGTVSTSILHDSEGVPVIASGVDGAGVEYIFWTQDSWSEETTGGLPTPTIEDDSDTPAFQEDNHTPWNIAHTDRWTDEPSGVGANMRYEFYSQRKKINGFWQAFGDVHLWNKYVIDGSSPYTLDLSNDQSLINCDPDGTVIGSYEPTTIMLFKGAQDAFSDFTISITANNISYTLSQDGRTITPSNITATNATISVTAALNGNNGVTLVAVYKINKTFAGENGVIYSLQPALSVIHVDYQGDYIDNIFSTQVKKIVGSTTTYLTVPADIQAAGLVLKYLQGGSSASPSDFTASANGIPTSIICGNAAYTTIFLYDTNNNLLDRERINKVADGEPGEQGAQGPMGLSGCHERVFQIYTPGMTYRNDEDATNISGIRYVDFMCIRNDALESGYSVYMCNDTHEAAATWEQDWNTGKWTPVSVNAASAYFNYIVAKNAHFEFGSSNQLVIYDSSNNIVGGLTGDIPDEYHEDDSVRIWAGGSNPSIAPFRVQQDGQFYSDKAHIKGLIEIKDSDEGLVVYGKSGSSYVEKVRITSGEVDEPMNVTGERSPSSGTISGSKTYNMRPDKYFDLPAITIPITVNGVSGELKAGSVISGAVGGFLRVTIKGNNNVMYLYGGMYAAPERLSYRIELQDSDNNVVGENIGVRTGSGEATELDDIELYFANFIVPKTASGYKFVVRMAIDTIYTDSSESNTWGGLAYGATVTAEGYMQYNISTPTGIRIGTNGMFINLASGKSVFISENQTEIKYGNNRVKVDPTGVYGYNGSAYIPIVKKTRTINTSDTVLADDGVLFLNMSSNITLTFNADSSKEVIIINKSSYNASISLPTGKKMYRCNGNEASSFSITDKDARKFIADSSGNYYELYLSN